MGTSASPTSAGISIGFLGRVYWAFVGNHHARQLFVLPIFNGTWWKEVLFELRWYLFLERDPKKYVGHNPLAQFSMFTLFLTTVVFMMVTGFALTAKVRRKAVGAHPVHLLGIPCSASQTCTPGTTWAVGAVRLHVYAAIREDIMSRQSLVSTMLSGWRMFKDDKP